MKPLLPDIQDTFHRTVSLFVFISKTNKKGSLKFLAALQSPKSYKSMKHSQFSMTVLLKHSLQASNKPLCNVLLYSPTPLKT